MSGPIIRSGPSPEFSRNWDSVFSKGGNKKALKGDAAASPPKAAKGTKKKAKKPAAKKPSKK